MNRRPMHEPTAQLGSQAALTRWRYALAALTGPYHRWAPRLGISTRADRVAELHDGRTLPVTPPLAVVGPIGKKRTRVMLVGNGPAESPGLPDSVEGFGALLARSLQLLVGGRVEVTTVLGGGWDLDALTETLEARRSYWSDALVVTAAYRPQLAAMPLRTWARYTERLREVLVAGTEPGTIIRVTSLPWRQAARDLPSVWGGVFGNRVIVLAAVAEAALRPGQPARALRLRAPLRRQEWLGPQFSPATLLGWADQVAQDLATQLAREPKNGAMTKDGLDDSLVADADD